MAVGSPLTLPSVGAATSSPIAPSRAGTGDAPLGCPYPRRILRRCASLRAIESKSRLRATIGISSRIARREVRAWDGEGRTIRLNSSDGPLRIGMVAACPMPARRGTPLRVERLAQALAARGHAVELMTYHLAEEDGTYAFPIRRIYDRVERGNLPPGPTFAKLLRYDPALARMVRRRLRAAPFDIVHAHHFEGLADLRLWASRHQHPAGLRRAHHAQRRAALLRGGMEPSAGAERGPQARPDAAAARRPPDRRHRGHSPATQPGIRFRSREHLRGDERRRGRDVPGHPPQRPDRGTPESARLHRHAGALPGHRPDAGGVCQRAGAATAAAAAAAHRCGLRSVSPAGGPPPDRACA